MKKPEIRRKIKEIKATVSREEALVAAEEAFARLEECEAFQRAENVLVYHSLPDELSTHAFIARWHKRKNLFLPRVNGETLDILPYDAMQMHTGAFNIEEPTGYDIVDASEIDLIIVPGIAFDCKGNRVGRGKGYYDRLLCGASATKIGVGYDFQLVDGEIEAEGHDMKVDAVITNRRCVFTPHDKGLHH